jgi:competence ComEA-like helix-hairpin-helix protein
METEPTQQESKASPHRNQALAILVLILLAITVAKRIPTSPIVQSDPIPITSFKPEVSFAVNLNEASLEELDLLPGLGVTLAREIIKLREKQNGFRSVEEIMQIRGIKGARFQELKPYIYVATNE